MARHLVMNTLYRGIPEFISMNIPISIYLSPCKLGFK